MLSHLISLSVKVIQFAQLCHPLKKIKEYFSRDMLSSLTCQYQNSWIQKLIVGTNKIMFYEVLEVFQDSIGQKKRLNCIYFIEGWLSDSKDK